MKVDDSLSFKVNQHSTNVIRILYKGMQGIIIQMKFNRLIIPDDLKILLHKDYNLNEICAGMMQKTIDFFYKIDVGDYIIT